MRIVFGLLLVLPIWWTSSSIPSCAQDIERATISESVVCRDNPAQNYALYLPSSYSAQQKWPIIYVFDPQARGSLPVSRFKPAAERCGYIVAGSNNSRNGPWPPVFEAMLSVWNDTHQRFTLDENRIYAAGFSGGARAASYLAQVVFNPVAGIIAFGAGLASGMTPDQIKPSVFFGAVGNRDFNYLEMIHLEKTFKEIEISHRLLVFEGDHSWPPEEICTQSLEWMHLAGMKSEITAQDKDFIDRIYAKEMASALDLEKAGLLARAQAEYNSLSSMFQGLKNTEEINQRMGLIRQRPDFESSVQKESLLEAKEMSFLAGTQKLFQAIEKTPSSRLNAPNTIAGLSLDILLVMAEHKGDSLERHMAIRVLTDISLYSERTGWTALDKKDHSKALFAFQIALKASEGIETRKPLVHYGLACVYAQLGQSSLSLDHLQRAVDIGFRDYEDMIQNIYLNPVREHRSFKELLDSLKKLPS